MVATWNASRTIRGMSFASLINQLCFVIGIVMPTVSHSWNASVPITAYGTWPVMTTSGTESMYASHNGVTMFVAAGTAGDHRDAGPAGRVRVAARHVTGALFVAHEDVPDRRVDERVVDGEDRPAREAEHDLHLLHLEALDQGLGSGELHGSSSGIRARMFGQ